MLSIKLYMHVLFIFISLYHLSWSSPNTAGEQTPLSKLKWRNDLETLVPKRLYRHGKSHLPVQGLAPRVVIDGNSVLVSWSTESMLTDALQEPTSTPDTHFQFNKREQTKQPVHIPLHSLMASVHTWPVLFVWAETTESYSFHCLADSTELSWSHRTMPFFIFHSFKYKI